MARVTKYKPLYPWIGGLNTSIDPMILDTKYLTVCDNVIFTSSGSRKKRPGQTRFNSSAVSGTPNFVYTADYWANVSNVKREYFVGITDDGKAYRSPFNGTWSSFSTLTLSVTQGGITSTVFNEDLILGIKDNGVPKVWKNQNTATNLVNLTSTSGSLPFTSAWIVSNFLERAVVAGDPAFPDRVYFSAAGSSQRWTATTVAGTAITLDVGVGDGDPDGITSIFTGTGADRSLYVGKRRHIYRIDCADLNQINWKITPITNEIGTLNPNVVCKIDETDVIFASDRGIHTLNQVLTTTAVVEGQFVSFPVQYDWNNNLVNSQRSKFSAVYVPSINSFLIATQRLGQTTFETVYGYNVEIKEWFRWVNVPCNFLCRRFNKSLGIDELYASGTGGFVNKLLQTALNDFGFPIVTQIKSSFIAPEGIPFQENQFTALACIYKAHENSSFTVYYSVDGITTKNVTFQQRIGGGNILGTTILGDPTFLLGSIQAIKPVWNHLGIEEGNTLQLTFIQDGLNQDFELFGIVIEYTADEESQNAFRSPLYS